MQIKAKLAAFLREDLKLELSPGKTLITHARTQRSRFLGYEISVASRAHRTRRPSATDRRNRRSLNGPYIWPDALGKDEIAAVSESEIVAVWPHRSEVPRDTWGHLFSDAEREIGVLVYAGLFLPEDAGVQKILKDKASSGLRVRILLGDPDSQVVTDRGEDEGVGDAMAAKIRNALALYRPLRAAGGVEFRFHRTILYNSIYRADDQVLVNTHVFGVTAAVAPVWHLRKLPGGELAGLYIDSFERVWETATPVDGA